MSRVAYVQAGLVVRVTDGMNAAQITAKRDALIAKQTTAPNPNEQAMIDDWGAHTLVDVASDAPVEVGDSYDGSTFTAGSARAAAEQEVSERTQLVSLVSQLRDIADGTQTISNTAQAVTAIRFIARFVLFLARAWLRRNL